MNPFLLTSYALNENIDGLVQERHNSIANLLEQQRLSCTNPSIWHMASGYEVWDA